MVRLQLTGGPGGVLTEASLKHLTWLLEQSTLSVSYPLQSEKGACSELTSVPFLCPVSCYNWLCTIISGLQVVNASVCTCSGRLSKLRCVERNPDFIFFSTGKLSPISCTDEALSLQIRFPPLLQWSKFGVVHPREVSCEGSCLTIPLWQSGRLPVLPAFFLCLTFLRALLWLYFSEKEFRSACIVVWAPAFAREWSYVAEVSGCVSASEIQSLLLLHFMFF